ncbi:MAG: hypothetical protein IKC10_03440 [Alphaproteobacteria bacterium]|nr:hypothetical protein [Alphaproteobacteria bacterium]
MTRIVVFASYDKDGIVHDYVLGYLRYLKEVADKIIFIADNYADEYEQNKLKELVDYAEFCPHGEYDFGSYKRGYYYAKSNGWLDSANKLIFCNDSCFCTSSLIPVFEIMEKRSCDFWGMTKSHEIQDHLQSYFLVFNSNVFTSKTFIEHINNVTHKDNFMDVVRCYELPFTSKLNDASFVSSEYIQFNNNINPTFYPYKTYKKGMPLIKKKIFSTFDYGKDSLWLIYVLLQKNKLFKKHVEECFSANSFAILGNIYKRRLLNFIYHKTISRNKIKIKIFNITVFKTRR